MAALARLFMPNTYIAPTRNFFNQYAKTHFKDRSKPQTAAPLFHLMLFTGVTGYVMEHFAIGQYHVEHKHHEQAAAMAAYKKNGGGGHH